MLAIRLIRDKYDAQRYQVSPVSRSEYLYAFAPTQNFQEIENSISNAYLSKVLPAKTPQSLFRLFATNLHNESCQGCAAPKATLTGLIMQILYFKRNKD